MVNGEKERRERAAQDLSLAQDGSRAKRRDGRGGSRAGSGHVKVLVVKACPRVVSSAIPSERAGASLESQPCHVWPAERWCRGLICHGEAQRPALSSGTACACPPLSNSSLDQDISLA